MSDDIMDMVSQARNQSIGDVLRRSAARHPGKTAVICGAVQWTYSELDDLCNRLARGLGAHGVAKGDRVAVLSRNSHSFVALRFAVARLGAILVPINFMLNPDEVRYILASSGAKLLGIGAEFAEVARAATADATAVEALFSLPGEKAGPEALGATSFSDLLDADASAISTAVSSQDVAQIIYTSGTESTPKGAVLTHGAVLWQYTSCIIDGGMATDDLVLHALPLYHCAQLDVFLGPAIYLGCTNVIIGQPSPDLIISLIASHRATSFFAPPTIWIGMLRLQAFDATALSSLRKGYYGASIMPVEALLELQRRLPEVRLWNFYGQTEIAPLATVLKPEDQLRKAGSAGKPALNVETRVVDSEMRDIQPGHIGEIVHRSPHLMSGYYNDPVKTTAAFSGGWFHSGDLATVDSEGYITVVDRVKDMIKSGGENVASREVEEVVYRLPEVSEVAVVGLPDQHWVEAVVAFIVVKSGHTLMEEDVIAHCKKVMASFKAPKGDVKLTAGEEICGYPAVMSNSPVSYKRHRFPPSVIAHAVWLYFRFPLSLRLVEEMLLERGIVVSYETIRCWAKKFGSDYAGRLRRKAPSPSDVWHLDEVVVTIRGRKHWLWRAVDQDGYVLDEIVQARRNTKAAKRLLIRLMKKQGCLPKRIVTDKLRSYGAARRQTMPTVEHRSHKGLNNRAENSHLPLRKRERVMQRFRSPGGLQRFVSVFSAFRNLFVPAPSKRSAVDVHLHRLRAIAHWRGVAGIAA